MAAELGQKFELTRAQATLAAYASLYLQEEVQAEGMVRQIGDFARFLEVISFSQGSLLNLANLAREAEIPRKRAESYLGILENLLISFRLPVFQRRAQRPAGCAGRD
jgi:predicted AAA+ superfamily ATPase